MTRRVERVSRAVFVVLLLAVLLCRDAWLPAMPPVLRAIRDILHFPAFALCFLCFYSFVARPGVVRFRAALAAAAGALLLAVLIEIVQPLVGRTREADDLVWGGLGILFGVLLVVSRLAGGRRARLAFGLSAVCIVVLPILAGFQSVREVERSRSAFPLLASFETSAELARWEVHGKGRIRADGRAGDGNRSLEIGWVGDDPYPGAFLTDCPPDWSGWSRLCMDVEADDDFPLPFWVRVDDTQEAAYGERFQRAFKLSPGINILCIPLSELRDEAGAALRLDHVAAFGFFIANDGRPGALRIDNVRLE